jgi:8-oxo-dGTP pyrophosphatase MutT (NUDIX family)
MHWRRTGRDLVHDAGIFRVRRDLYEYRGVPTHPFSVIEAAPWTNVVAVTEARDVVLVRQFRHGVEADSLEVPGGMVDREDASPAEAAARELLEETGYACPRLEPLLSVTSNPAILTNRTHFFLARGARRVAEPVLAPDEDLTVELHPVGAIRGLIASGEVHHSLCVCALSLYLLGNPRA